MAYDAIAHDELDVKEKESLGISMSRFHSHLDTRAHFQPLPQADFDNSPSPVLFMDHQREPGSTCPTSTLAGAVQNFLGRSSEKTKYEAVHEDDYDQELSKASPVALVSRSRAAADPNAGPSQAKYQQPKLRQVEECGLTPKGDANRDQKNPQVISAPRAQRLIPDHPLRTASGRRAPLQHPTPDLQTLQGAYMANVEHLERTAERLSMTSSIDDAIRQMHQEQKKSDSRRSSLLASPAEITFPTRQISNGSSIVELNSAARSGGFSPGGFSMASPRDQISSFGMHNTLKNSKSSRPEPELEGRPLDSFVNYSFSGESPSFSFTTSLPERIVEREKSTMIIEQHKLQPPAELRISNPDDVESERPTTSASITTFDQAQKMFSDFDGEHISSLPIPSASERGDEGSQVGGSQFGVGERNTSGNRTSFTRPKSYLDPSTGQSMLYYPAPVPIMLNLPAKISRLSAAEAARAKRTSQVLNSLPAANRQSALWLPDVLEDEADSPLTEEDPAQNQEYLAQHQRTTMGGRRSTKDLAHLPPQLRASAFFDVPGPSQLVEVKEQSAVKTLDSILDASAFAPVSAFTDHLIAGRLGAEVYGNKRTSKPMNADNSYGLTKRKSLTDLLMPKRSSSGDLLKDERRRFTMSTGMGRDTPDGEDNDFMRRTPDQDDNDEEEEEEDEEDEIYTGAPTTLLAELQIRKQQQKERTRPHASAYPNGMHSTLLEMDAVAQVQKKSRNLKRVNLAWEAQDEEDNSGDDGDDDVPLAILFPSKNRAHLDESRPMGLMERREMEDNEPLSQRRDRLQGKPKAVQRASTMMGMPTAPEGLEGEDETLAQRLQRLKAQGGTVTGLPSADPVSGDFANDLMSQFGGDLSKIDKGKEKETATPEEEETLGQRRKRLQAEKEAHEKELAANGNLENRPGLKKRHSMADILTAHPAAVAGNRSSSYGRPVSGLLALHDQKTAQRSSTMLNMPNHPLPLNANYNPVQDLDNANRTQSFGGYNNMPNMNSGFGQGYHQPSYQMNFAPQPMPYASARPVNGMYGYQNPMAAQMIQMQNAMAEYANHMGVPPFNQGQADMVERWRQSVMQ